MIDSFHYYACYCALLCFLHHQQQAVSLTIIIDGASTNEWATRDEYQRLVESGFQEPAAVAALAEQEQLARLEASATGGQLSGRSRSELQREQQEQQVQEALGSRLSGLFGGSSEKEQQLRQQQLNNGNQLEELPIPALNRRLPLPGGKSAREQLELALDRLDLIEEQQKQQRLLEQQQQQQPVSRTRSRHRQLGARTFQDLVGERDLRPEQAGDPAASQEADGQRASANQLARLKERDMNPQKFCGKQLIESLDLVCQGRYFEGDGEPVIAAPTVKNKRYVDSSEHLNLSNNNNNNNRAEANRPASSSRRSGTRSKRQSISQYLRGPNQECCERPCTLDDMKVFCSKYPTRIT